ncbi:class III poly(R)-hydroxyalkanoic acid synthase subunit PhaE [Xanthomonas sp. GPE 39]|uniref:class III poly(R)-hydroxyalkanoic acid synthase subunit PhaE n=1 Tax=Xanthomonas sp. GPE 39 TaxID=1583099 RepID=UPI0005F2B5BF|nr:class III poly(R)-hydroxyalkanoic acid synthase subunit PhaE [Xanthomonas sp. GPE 39]
MKASGGTSPGDFEAMARQYWGAWSAMLQHGSTAAAAAPMRESGSWREAIDAWAQWLPSGTSTQAEDAVAKFQQHACAWLGAMQQVAASFAGRDASSAEVADAWKLQVQSQREQCLQWLLGSLRGATLDPWLQQTAQWMQSLQRDSSPWLQMPGFGPARNHHARWRALTKAQQEYLAQSQAYLALLHAAIDRAFAVFEEKLRAHEDPGRQLTNARAMFDLWIDAAEEAYAAAALSPQFQQVYADFANAQMRLRALLQRELEQVCEQMGLPTRTELDAAHGRIADLERRLRRLERGAGQGAGTAHPPAAERASAAALSTPPAAPAKRAASKKAPAKTAQAMPSAPAKAHRGLGASPPRRSRA